MCVSLLSLSLVLMPTFFGCPPDSFCALSLISLQLSSRDSFACELGAADEMAGDSLTVQQPPPFLSEVEHLPLPPLSLPLVPSSLSVTSHQGSPAREGHLLRPLGGYSSADQYPCLSPTLQQGGEAVPQEPWNSRGNCSGNWSSSGTAPALSPWISL